MLDIKEIAKKARNAGYDYSILDTKSKNEALYAIADELDNNREAIFSVVLVKDQKGNVIARGITRYSSDELNLIKKKSSSSIENILGFTHGDEAIHRDDLVVIDNNK